MEEKNRKTLENAILGLPSHEPPQEVWDRISIALAADRQDRGLAAATRALPRYQPPETVWQGIEQDLQRHRRWRARRRPLLRLSAAAAAVALLLLFFSPLRNGLQADKVTLVAYQETAADLPSPDWNADEAAIQLVVSQFSSDIQARQDEAYHRLLAEITELNRAKSELRAAISKYGADGALLRQLAELERERTAVVKAMAATLSRQQNTLSENRLKNIPDDIRTKG